MSKKYGKGRLPSLKDKYEEAVEADLAARTAALAKEIKKVEKKPKRKKKNA